MESNEMTVPTQQSGHQPARWDPFRPFEDLYTQVGRLWGSAFGPGSGADQGGGWSPLVDVCETQDAYTVDIDVPGVKQQDLDVKVSGNELTVTGELKETERDTLFRTRTRRTGQFGYRMRLPRHVDADQITANLTDGVLTVRIPKGEIGGPRNIEVTA